MINILGSLSASREYKKGPLYPKQWWIVEILIK